MEIFEKIVSDSKDANNNIYNITIGFLKQVEENCTTLIQLIRKVEATNLIKFAFICGIINGFIEFVCGVLDVVILVITLLFKANLENNAEFKLDYLQLKEAIEELIEAWLKDPDFLDKEIQQFITTYTDIRYKNPKLTPYQIAHNTGEDLILTLDIVLSFVAIIKALTSSTKLVPKFTKWIDDVLENGGKGARKFEDSLIDDFIKLSDELVLATKDKTLFQRSSNLDEWYGAAEVASKELEVATTGFAKITKVKPGFRDGLKSRERAIEKIESDYLGDASRLLDIAGSKIVYETVDDLYIAFNKFNKEYKILKIKDRIQKPLNGYRDVLMNIEMNNGHIVEFRLHLKEMDDVANGVGHSLNEQQRKLDVVLTKRPLTKIEKDLYKDLIVKQNKLFDEAWSIIVNK